MDHQCTWPQKFGSGVDVHAYGILAYEIVTGKVPYYELGEVTPFVLANKAMSRFTSNVPEKMQELIKKCWSDNPSDRPSFDEIFKTLSSDFSYSDESADEEEIEEYISTLNGERRDKKDREKAEIIVSMLSEIEEPKEKCRSYEILQSTNDDFITGLNCIDGTNTNISPAISSLERSSESGNRYVSYLKYYIFKY